MAQTPLLLTVEDYLSNSMGGPTPRTDRTLTEAEIYRALQTVTRLINEAAYGQLLVRSITDEIRRFRIDPDSGAYVIRLIYKPVRIVTAVSYVIGQYWGGRSPAPADLTPVENVPAPVIEGNMVINRNSNILMIYSPRVIYAPAMWTNPMTGNNAGRLAISYTVGYDDGTVQPDGVSMPLPEWVKEAARSALVNYLSKRMRVRRGRALAGSYRLGNISETYSGDIDFELPQSVKDMIARNTQNWGVS
jgi:hypothetical protein